MIKKTHMQNEKKYNLQWLTLYYKRTTVCWCQGSENLLLNWRGQVPARVISSIVLPSSHILHR